MGQINRAIILLVALYVYWKTIHFSSRSLGTEDRERLNNRPETTSPARRDFEPSRVNPFLYLGENISFSPVFARGNGKAINKSVNYYEGRGIGYSSTGGPLPTDDHPTYPNPLSWPSIDNGTCTETSVRPVFQWLKRAPYAILIGVMKGGTHALSEYLWTHPSVCAPTDNAHELHFFDGSVFRRNEHGISQRYNQLEYARLIQRKYSCLFQSGQKPITIHDSPRYMLWSDRIPDAIFCVTPWAKLLAVLRNPVERAVSHYRFQDEARRRKGIPMVDWEKWIDDDVRLLNESGVVRDWSKVDFAQFSGSDEEMQSWKRYLRNRNSQMIVGRGLYALQLDHYLRAMDRVGKPRSDLLVIRSEDLRRNTQKEYDRVLQFLDLSQHTLDDVSARHETNKDSTAIPVHLREKLLKIYEPYNDRLYNMMGWDTPW